MCHLNFFFGDMKSEKINFRISLDFVISMYWDVYKFSFCYIINLVDMKYLWWARYNIGVQKGDIIHHLTVLKWTPYCKGF